MALVGVLACWIPALRARAHRSGGGAAKLALRRSRPPNGNRSRPAHAAHAASPRSSLRQRRGITFWGRKAERPLQVNCGRMDPDSSDHYVALELSAYKPLTVSGVRWWSGRSLALP